MNKQDIVRAIAGETGLTQIAVGKMLGSLENQVVKALEAGDKVQITGFFTAKPVARAARKGYDPIKGESMEIEPTVGVVVRAGESLKKAVKLLNYEDYVTKKEEKEEK